MMDHQMKEISAHGKINIHKYTSHGSLPVTVDFAKSILQMWHHIQTGVSSRVMYECAQLF